MSNSLPFAKAGEDGVTDRLSDQKRCWRQVGEYVRENKIKHVFLVGDIYDKAKVDPITLAETTKSLSLLAQDAQVYVMAGNHDAESVRGGRYNVEYLQAIEGISYIKAGEVLQHPSSGMDVNFWPVEYMPAKETRGELEKIRAKIKDTSAINVLLFHNSVIGCKHLAWVCDDGLTQDEMLDGFDYAIGGHFHTQQFFGPGERGMYTGSWMQFDFGDSGDKRGFLDVTFGNKIKVKHVRLDAPRFWIGEWKSPLEWPKRAKAGDYIRFDLECTHAEYTLVKPDIAKVIEAAQSAGYNVQCRQKPIYHHAQRIVEPELDRMNLLDITKRYVKSDFVDVESLNRVALAKLGVEIMEEAQHDLRNNR